MNGGDIAARSLIQPELSLIPVSHPWGAVQYSVRGTSPISSSEVAAMPELTVLSAAGYNRSTFGQPTFGP
jgi:hypothetical protein